LSCLHDAVYVSPCGMQRRGTVKDAARRAVQRPVKTHPDVARERPPRGQRRMPVERRDPLPEERCYLCDSSVARTDEIVRVHEATMHRRC